MSEPLVLVDSANPAVKVITLNRPEKRNALSVALMEELTRAIGAAAEEPRCRVIILRANGPAFCAGLDLNEAASPQNSETSARALAQLYETICLSPLVTIAAAQGAVMGGGVGLLAACDLVVASEDFHVAFPEVRRGLVAALVSALLRRQLPARTLRELILLAESISADRAMAIGLVNRVVSPAEILNEAAAMAAQIIEAAPLAIARSKALLDDLSPRPIADDLARALHHHLQARDGGEAAEGIAAFLEKRPPRWIGRSQK